MATNIIAKLLLVVQLLGFYPQTFTITYLDYEKDIVRMESATGYVYEMTGCEDWAVGDLASCIMYDNDTEDIEDDIVVVARFTSFYLVKEV